ncbi:MAG: hypothetical protein IKS42_07370 [Oscillospiraceae bacterium]|nr:hypothetical protein [Oscillospiraceae bacterium]
MTEDSIVLKKFLRCSKKTLKRGLDASVRVGSLHIRCIPKQTKVVSFDIFDTLLCRDTAEPTDVFRLMELGLKQKGFAEKRILAEQKAREQRNNGEVTIYDIYRAFGGLTESQIRGYAQRELRTEMSLCHPSQSMLRFFAECRQYFRVVLISDMYLPADMMKQLLDHCGITGYEKLYISCDAGCAKADGGKLYDFAAQDLGVTPKQITHIGNDISADAVKALSRGLHVIKVQTKPAALISGVTCSVTQKDPAHLQKNMLCRMIGNTAPLPSENSDFYYRFGYENFGVLLWGFCKWLLAQMKQDGIEQVLFVARDGYMIQRVYEKLQYQTQIPCRYFEMSRRSIRVAASFRKELSYEEILPLMALTSRVSIEQIFDAWGLSSQQHADLCASLGIGMEDIFWEKTLISNEKIRALYDALRTEIKENAQKEYDTMLRYVKGFQLEKKTAFVDIGWRGTIQKELLKALKSAGMRSDLCGYYLALDSDTAMNTVGITLHAKGYLWDHYNGSGDSMEEKPYACLLESFFLEQGGSVKRYTELNGEIIAERYPYEYAVPGGLLDETALVRRVQAGALDFVDAVMHCCAGQMKHILPQNAFCFLRKCLMDPSAEIQKHFGDFRFFNHGDQSFLARPKRSLPGYCLHPKELIADFYESQWKIGFFKALFRLPLPYETMWRMLKRIFPSGPVKQ